MSLTVNNSDGSKSALSCEARVAQVGEIHSETALVKTFTLKPLNGNMAFLPGQYVRLLTPVKDGSLDARDYSITSSPSKTEFFQIAVKRLQDSRSTTYLHDQTIVGDLLSFVGPLGQFCYHEGASDSLVLVAGGIGVTPMLSIVRFIHERSTQLSVALLYSAQFPSEMAFLGELIELSNRDSRIGCIFTVTRSSSEPWSGLRGRINKVMLADTLLEKHPIFYLCGPNEMLDHLVNILKDLGVEKTKIKVDRWF